MREYLKIIGKWSTNKALVPASLGDFSQLLHYCWLKCAYSRDEEDGRRPLVVVALHHDVGVVGRGQEDEEADEALLQAAKVSRVDLAEEVEAEDGIDQHHEHHQTQHVQDRRQALQNLSNESERESIDYSSGLVI